MALTRVSRHIIDEPFNPTTVSATDVTATNINASGIGTVGTLRVTGDLTVEGTTTTLDSILTEVDRLEVSANSTVAAGIITQTGSGDILRLFDGASEVFSVADGGAIKIGGSGQLALDVSYDGSSATAAKIVTNTGITNANSTFTFAVNENSGAQMQLKGDGSVIFSEGSTERLRIDSAGRLLLGSGAIALPKGTSAGSFDLDNGTITMCIGGNVNSTGRTNSTDKIARFTSPHYTNAEQPVLIASSYNISSSNTISYGGGSSLCNAATSHVFYTAADTTTVVGTERLRIDPDGKVRVPDNGKFIAGASADLEIYHNGTHSYIDNVTNGALIIRNTSNDVDVVIESDDGSGGLASYFRADGSAGDAILYHYGNVKLATKSTGIQVTGQIDIGTTTIYGTGDISMGDSDKLRLGSGDDLRIYHNGSHSYIDETGEGNLYIRNGTKNSIFARTDGEVILYHNGNSKFETTSTGVKVPDSQKLLLGTGDDLQIFHGSNISYVANYTGELVILNQTDDGDVSIHSDNGSGGTAAYFRADGSTGNAILYHYGAEKLATTSTGAKVTGALEVTQEYPSIRPTLDLNFAATKTLDRRITFTRDSIGTYVDENGLVKYASNNVPRFDHDPTTGESLGLLSEESRTNYVDNSNDVSQWNRIINNATVESNTTDTLSPDGTNTSTKITGGTNSGISRDGILSVSASTVYTASIFAKKGIADSFKLEFGTGANQFQADFNLTTKAFSNTSAGGWFASVSTSYVDYPNGWVRVILTGTTSGSASGSPNFAVYGISSGYVYFWGGQAEVGSFVTSLIPTHGSTVTRAADLTKITGTNFTDFYNQTEGSTVFEAKTFKGDSGNVYYGEIGRGSSNRNIMYRNTSSGNAILYYTSGGSTVVNSLSSGAPSQVNTNVVTAYAYKENDFGVFASGGYSNTDTSGNVTDNATSFSIGMNNIYSGEHLNGTIKRLSYYNKRLPNAQLQGLTQQ